MDSKDPSGFPQSEPPNSALPKIKSIFDFTAEALEELAVWLEQRGLTIPVTQLVGYNTNTVRVYKKATGTLAVSNTTTETPVVDETIPGGSMNTLGIVRLTVLGDWVNTGPSLCNFTWKVNFGGTTFESELTGTGLMAATVFPVKLVVDIANLNATNSNQSWAERWGVTTTPGIFESTAQTIDTSIQQPLQVTITPTVAQAGATFTRRHYMIEFL